MRQPLFKVFSPSSIFGSAYNVNRAYAHNIPKEITMPSFTNRATLSYSGGVTESNTVTGNITETLSATKLTLSNSYAGATRLTYVINLVNSGSASFTGLTLTDDLGGYEINGATVYPLNYVDGSLLYLINGAEQPAPTVTAGPPLTVSGVSVPAGGNATIIYQADTTAFAPLDVESSITNTVTVTGAGLTEPVTASATVNSIDEPQLTITKALDPTVVPENGTITYTFVISNSGNTEAVATDDVVVTDLFDPILNITSVTLNGTPLSLGTGYTYNASTGLFQTVSGVITVPAATYTQAPDGSISVNEGTAVLTVTGTI